MQDAADFAYLVRSNVEVDLEIAFRLGESIFPGGGKELVEKIGQARSGHRMTF